MARKDWLLMALALREGAPMDPAQVQKAMFLLGRQMADEVGPEFYRFRPYNYGPFDSDIYTDLQHMAGNGLITIAQSSRGTRSFSVTPAGLREGTELVRSLDPVARTYLKKVVDWVCSLRFADLVRAIYDRYPEFRRNSVFAG